MEFVCPNPDKQISEEAYAEAARQVDCDVAAVKAVAEVESRGDPFKYDDRPTILFERHIFRKFTGHRFDDSHPDLSGPWKPGTYGSGSSQWGRMEAAIELDREAALKSASWGQFQVMGFNAEICGWSDVELFAAAMAEDVDNHLDAFIGFVMHNNLDRHLRNLDWPKFARGYNGSGFAKNKYDLKMAAAYEKYASDPAVVMAPEAVDTDAFQVLTVRDLQMALAYLNISPGKIDNKMGPKTRDAITKFQRFIKAEPDGKFSTEVRAAAQAAYHMMRKFDALASE